MNTDEIYKRIMVMDSVKSATSYMKNSEITKSDLSKLCKRHNIFVDDKSTKESMITLFINSTIGVKLKNKAKNRYKTK
ncbi:hypothetical protein [Clostridium intestinale]|jgi:hypothetical protein|uniref:Uncharacterized protein n=2 Tax=Clostridium intestinale TaxID=36845 RepID=U2NKB6_9CLOT|nr:hypothetical protein [Clostridium intestinale]ERK29316.1 hypothetical protein CINTURNW_3456 [Clostridium intestinale URNW]QLY80599.1 hypothetical protein HZF06_03165 [Clostridium intestinale]